MKQNKPTPLVLVLIPVALVIGACASSDSDLAATIGKLPVEGASMAAYVEGVPGGVMVDSSEITATVSAVDKKKRTVTLTASDGKSFTAKVGPEAVNFGQVEVGDQVQVGITQTMEIFMGDAASASMDGEAMVSMQAAEGEKPGLAAAGAVQATATVMAIDEQSRTATLEFPDGTSETFPVRADVDLSKRKIGEQVVFQLATLVTLEVAAP